MEIVDFISVKRDGARIISTEYDIDQRSNDKPKLRHYMTSDRSVDVGDFVVVPTGTRWRMGVVRVVECDLTLEEIDTSGITWIVAKVPI